MSLSNGCTSTSLSLSFKPKEDLLGEKISDMTLEQLSQLFCSGTFYMNSYLVYIAIALGPISHLSTKDDCMTMPVWMYYNQLTLRSNHMHYRRVQDAFFVHYMCLFNKELPKKRVSDEA